MTMTYKVRRWRSRVRGFLIRRAKRSGGGITDHPLPRPSPIKGEGSPFLDAVGLVCHSEPRQPPVIIALEVVDRCGFRERDADVVQALQQLRLARSIDGERVLPAVGCGDELFGKIDRHNRTWLLLHLAGEQRDDVLCENDGQQAVLQAIRLKDVAEARGDDGAKAEVGERIDCALPRRAASEVASRHQYACLVIRRLMKNKRFDFALRRVAFIVEEKVAITRGQRFAQKMVRDDLVGIDVGKVVRRGNRGEGPKSFHQSPVK